MNFQFLWSCISCFGCILDVIKTCWFSCMNHPYLVRGKKLATRNIFFKKKGKNQQMAKQQGKKPWIEVINSKKQESREKKNIQASMEIKAREWLPSLSRAELVCTKKKWGMVSSTSQQNMHEAWHLIPSPWF